MQLFLSLQGRWVEDYQIQSSIDLIVILVEHLSLCVVTTNNTMVRTVTELFSWLDFQPWEGSGCTQGESRALNPASQAYIYSWQSFNWPYSILYPCNIHTNLKQRARFFVSQLALQSFDVLQKLVKVGIIITIITLFKCQAFNKLMNNKKRLNISVNI